MPEAVNELLVARQIVVPANVKDRVYRFMAERLLAQRAFQRGNDVDAVCVGKPYPDAILAVSPFRRWNHSDLDGMPGQLELTRDAVRAHPYPLSH